MKLWILVYRVGDLELFLTPDNKFSVNRNDALKFKEEGVCKKYISDFPVIFLDFVPTEYEFEENYLHA